MTSLEWFQMTCAHRLEIMENNFATNLFNDMKTSWASIPKSFYQKERLSIHHILHMAMNALDTCACFNLAQVAQALPAIRLPANRTLDAYGDELEDDPDLGYATYRQLFPMPSKEELATLKAADRAEADV